jgi:UMF1 family MFS transporter
MLKKSLQRLWSTLRSIRHYKYMLLFLIAYFFYIDGVGTIIKMATTYADALSLDQTTILLGLLVTQVVAFPCSILYGNLGTKYSAKRLLQFGILTYLLVCGVGFIMRESWHFYLLATLVGTAQGGIQALSRSYFGRLIENKQRSGEFFGFYNIFGKFESVMGTFLMARVVSATNNVHFGVIPVLASFIIGFVLLLLVPNDKKGNRVNI